MTDIARELDLLAQKAAWMLENGATNENRDLCEDVVALCTALAEVAWRRKEDGIWIYYESEAWPDLEPLFATGGSD